MKNFRRTIYLVSLLSFITACSTTRHAGDNKQEWKPAYKIQAGVNQGGIAENDDLSLLEGTSLPNVDTYSGATSSGVNLGAHMILPTRRNNFEIGLDYMFNDQTFTYTKQATGYAADRDIITSQFLFPVTYNIGLFRSSCGEASSHLKLGYVFQVNMFSISDEDIGLPDYSTNNFSKGVTLGFDAIPFTFKNGAKLGLFIDVYRGSQIYEDVFNQESFVTPGSCYLKAGLIYQLKN